MTPPARSHGTTVPVVIWATQLNQRAGSLIALRIADVDGNVTDCNPVMQTVAGESGRPKPTTITDLPQAEGDVMFINSDSGVRSEDLAVNRGRFHGNHLRDGETRVVDVTSAMHAGNTMTSETISDERNATVDVDVLIWDGQYDALVVSTGRSLEAPVVRQWRQSGIQVSGSSARPFAEIRDGADDRHGRVRFCA